MAHGLEARVPFLDKDFMDAVMCPPGAALGTAAYGSTALPFETTCSDQKV